MEENFLAKNNLFKTSSIIKYISIFVYLNRYEFYLSFIIINVILNYNRIIYRPPRKSGLTPNNIDVLECFFFGDFNLPNIKDFNIKCDKSINLLKK